MSMLAQVAIGLVIGLVPIFVLRVSLERILIDLCGTHDRARFWTKYTWTLVVIAPVLGAMMSTPVQPRFSEAYFESTFKSALGGLFVALLGVGLTIARITSGIGTRVPAARAGSSDGATSSGSP